MPSALFSYGFRPFFLLAGVWAILALSALLGALTLGAWPSDALPLTRWHGHEMLFGFVAAAIAGFLLTAVPTWTGSRPVSGAALACLVLLWLAGRAVLSPVLGLQGTPWILLDAAFFPALAVTLGVPLVRSRNYRNLQFLLFLGLLAAADVWFLGSHLKWLGPLPFDPLRLAANLVLLMIAVVGGRIIPAFTRNALLQSGRQCAISPVRWLDRATLVAVAAVVVADLVRPDTPVAGSLAAFAALLLAVSASRWQGYRTLRMPIVAILHVGYVWLVVALALKSAWLLAGAPWAANWLHALTAGAFGTMILAVMTRVALGHTGRALVVARPIAVAYVLVVVAAVLRVAAPSAPPAYYLELLLAASALWGASFLIFLGVYSPILFSPRPDEQPRGT
jgi:uncharacterized protein involved in response to NO